MIKKFVAACALGLSLGTPTANAQSGSQQIGLFCVDFGYLAHQIYAGRQEGLPYKDTMKHIANLLSERSVPPNPELFRRLDQALRDAYAFSLETSDYEAGVGAFAFGSFYEDLCLNDFKGS